MPRREPATTTDRAQRTLGVMAATVFGLTALAIVLLFITRIANVPQSAYASGPLQLLVVFPLPGLAISLILVISLIVVGAVSRARASRH